MCGRFAQHLTGRQIHELYQLPESARPLHLHPRYNGAPVQDFAVCRLDADGSRALVTLRWGLVPSWAKDFRRGARLNQRPCGDRPRHAVVQRCLPRTSMSGASQWMVRMATNRARQTAGASVIKCCYAATGMYVTAAAALLRGLAKHPHVAQPPDDAPQGHEDVPKRQPPRGKPRLHRRRPRLVSELQRPMRPNEVVVAT